MSFMDRSQPREREDLLPLGQPKPDAPPTIASRLGGAAIELEEIEHTLNRAKAAFFELQKAIAGNDPVGTIAAANKLRGAGDLWAQAKHFCKVVTGKLR